ncbi:lipopolysaccharide biosynthesis protein [Flavobacterium frigidarium]|uniref:Lipopolysaccharide biosynthesis protein n=1 Tax=Flavobacterium frigidarium TaxID=99286 RepID=A0ABV4KCQ7_9FLAO
MSRSKIITDSIWSVSSNILTLLIALISNVVFARFMTPTEFGQLSIIMFFVSVCNVFTDGGLSGALVRKMDKKEEDYSTVFTFNLILSSILFIGLILASKTISEFYNQPSLQSPIVATSFILIISTFQTIQNIRIIQDLEFKTKAIITLLSAIFGTSIGFFFGYFLNLGVWALISIPIATASFQVFLCIYYKGFFFKLHLNRNSFKELFGFGINTTFVSVLNMTFDNIYQLILGRLFSISTVGFYYQAKKLQDVPNNLINNLSQGVFYSTLVKSQNDKDDLIKNYSLISTTFIWLVGFAVLLVLLFGDQFVLIILGQKWLESVYFIKLLIIGSIFYTQEIINKIIFKIYNRTKTLLRLEIIKKIVQTLTLLLGIYLKRIDILLYGYIFTNMFSCFLNHLFTRKILEVGNEELVFLCKVCLLIFSLVTFYWCITIYVKNILLLIIIGCALVMMYVFLSKIFSILDINSFSRKLIRAIRK